MYYFFKKEKAVPLESSHKQTDNRTENKWFLLICKQENLTAQYLKERNIVIVSNAEHTYVSKVSPWISYKTMEMLQNSHTPILGGFLKFI